MIDCPNCYGSGRVEIQIECPRCRGTGMRNGNICCGGVDEMEIDCEECDGTGKIEDEEEMTYDAFTESRKVRE